MTEGRSVCSRIRNARNSLDNAERSFRSNQEVRGELDLMLAEAELENLRQKRSGRFAWTRHMLAACLAVLVLAAGGLGWWWASAYGGNTTNAAGLPVLPAAEQTKKPAALQAPAKDTVHPEKNTAAAVQKEAGKVQKNPVLPERKAVNEIPNPGNRESGIQLSSGQMRQLIRSGKQELGNVKQLR